MLTTEEVNRIIDHGNEKIMSAIFLDLIADHKTSADNMKELWGEYEGKADILDRAARTGVNENKSNAKLANDYPGMIVDQVTDYTFSNGITQKYNEEVGADKALEVVSSFRNANKMRYTDYNVGQMMSAVGQASRLLYIDTSGEIGVAEINPWSVIFIWNGALTEIDFALYYYEVKLVNVLDQTKNDIVFKVEWYEKDKVYFYQQKEKDGYFSLDESEPVNPLTHRFKEVPFVNYANNTSYKGDFEKVRSLVAAYDETVSDQHNEIMDLRNAYLLFKGVIPEPEDIDKAKVTGAWASEDIDVDITFITKEINADFTIDEKKTLNENIYKFSKRVDMSDEKFSGSGQSGEGRKWKLLALTFAGKNKFDAFASGNTDMYRIIQPVLALKRKAFDYTQLEENFTANLPVELLYYADVATKLMPILSTETVLGLLPFIENPKAEMEKIEAEREALDIQEPDLETDED